MNGEPQPGAPCFADTARRLAGIAGWLLHWGPDAFWAATPTELGAVLWAVTDQLADVALPPDAHKLAQLQEMYPDGR